MGVARGGENHQHPAEYCFLLVMLAVVRQECIFKWLHDYGRGSFFSHLGQNPFDEYYSISLLTISPQIIRIGKSLGDEDMFEVQAREYPPVSRSIYSRGLITDNWQLFHAMMALSALSIAHKKGSHTANALEHYQQVIPALKTTVQSSQDSYVSDCFFLSPCILRHASFSMHVPRCGAENILIFQ